MEISEPNKDRVRVVIRREGDITRCLVENLERVEVTVSFNFQLTNLKSTVPLPRTATFPARQTTEAFRLSPVDPSQPSEYSFTNYYYLGSELAVHDDSYLYSLPYAAGSAFRVSQGYDGSFSHKGPNRYAIDWRMPEGTPVHAARGGVVVKIKDSSTRGGANVKFDRYNNFVLIRHSDGTLGQYCHLQKDSVNVREGDEIKTGDLLALSGNTGFSSGPHLHFSVYKIKNGRERETIPVKFQTAEAVGITLRTSEKHTAAIYRAPLPETHAAEMAPPVALAGHTL